MGEIRRKRNGSGRTSPWLSGGGQALTGRHIILLLDINHLRESQSQARHSRTIIKTSMSSWGHFTRLCKQRKKQSYCPSHNIKLLLYKPEERDCSSPMRTLPSPLSPLLWVTYSHRWPCDNIQSGVWLGSLGSSLKLPKDKLSNRFSLSLFGWDNP